MDQKFFWNSWHGFYRVFYRSLLLVFILSALAFGVSYLLGTSQSIGWDITDKIERLVLKIGSFDIHIFPVDLFGDNFLILQEFKGGLLHINTWSTYGLLLATAFFLIIYLSITSALKRFWYFIFTATAIVLLLSLKFEQILLFGSQDNRGFIIALLFYIPLSYYFHAFSPSTTLKVRLAAFTLVTVVFAFIIYYFSGVDKPFLHLGHYGITAALTVTAIFILITAQEFVYLFLWIITRSAGSFSRNNTLHFTVISLIYIINLILVWLKNTGSISWNILYLDAYFLFPAVAFIGIWGFRKKGEMMRGILNFEPWGGILYLVFGILSFVTLSYFFVNAQDPYIEAYEDLIIYSQFGLGTLFFVYVIANFYTPMDHNMKVYKVVYDPKRMPYITANIAGIIAMVAIFAKSGFFALDQIKAGYFNGLGDLYSETVDEFAAESYYQLGILYSEQNHRSNYSMASIYEKRDRPDQALFFYKRAILKKPTAQSYVNTSRIFNQNGLYFDALFTLQEGLKKFPSSSQINNNLGLLYAETNILDSAAIYFSTGSIRSSDEVSRANLMAVLARNDFSKLFNTENLDSIVSVYRSSELHALRNNLLVNLTKSGLRLPYEGLDLPTDSVFNPADIAFLGNELIHFREIPDTATVNRIYQFADTSNLGMQAEELKFSLIIHDYFSGNINRAIRRLNDLRISSFNYREKFGLVLGKLLMRQEAYYFAGRILEESGISNDVRRNLALCYNEQGHNREALQIWMEVASSDSLDGRARTMSRVLGLKELPEPEKMDDTFKYLLACYGDFSAKDLESIVRSIEHEYLKPMAYLELYERSTDSLEAERFYELVTGNLPVEGFLSKKHLRVELERLAESKNLEKLEKVLNSIDQADPLVRWEYNFYRAKLEEINGNADAARIHYDYLANNAFFEKGVLAAVNFYLERNPDRAYSLALEAVEVNPFSIPISKKYVELAFQTGLDNYATSVMNDLRSRMEEKDFLDFEAEINELRETMSENQNF